MTNHQIKSKDIKNNMDEKARYFGMYIGKADIIHEGLIDSFTCIEIRHYLIIANHNCYLLDDCQLILKPLSKLTDEDAKKVFPYSEIIWKGNTYPLLKDKEQELIDKPHLEEWFELSRLGYAIPVLGKLDPFEIGWAIER